MLWRQGLLPRETTPHVQIDPWPGPLVVLRVPPGARPALRAAIFGVAAYQDRLAAWLEVGPPTARALRRQRLGALGANCEPIIGQVAHWSTSWRWASRLVSVVPRAWVLIEAHIDEGVASDVSARAQAQALGQMDCGIDPPGLSPGARTRLMAQLDEGHAKVIVMLDELRPNPCEKTGQVIP